MRNRMVVIVVAMCVVTFFLSREAFAEQKVAFVDLGSVFDGYEKTKTYDSRLEGSQKGKQEEIDKKVEEIKALQDKLALLSDKQKKKKQKEIDEKTKELQEFQRNSEMSLLKDRDERLKEILQDIQEVVESVAKKQKYDLIFNERVLLYGDDSMDISQTILKQLNEKNKK